MQEATGNCLQVIVLIDLTHDNAAVPDGSTFRRRGSIALQLLIVIKSIVANHLREILLVEHPKILLLLCGTNVFPPKWKSISVATSRSENLGLCTARMPV